VLPTKWALGYSVGRLGSQDSTSAFGIGGSGGSFAYGDHAKGVSCAVTKICSRRTSTPRRRSSGLLTQSSATGRDRL